MARVATRGRVLLCLGVLWALASIACSGAPRPVHGSARPEQPCPTSLFGALPSGATSWLFLRPRAITEHPRLGPVVARSFDGGSERALIYRARRTGYDPRALERALIAWRPDVTFYAAHGAFDHERVSTLLWERLLGPRRRVRAPDHDERLEGTQGDGSSAALLLAPRCGLAAYAEGREMRVVDRVLTPRAERDPPELLRWHVYGVPDALARAEGTALARTVRELEIRLRDEPQGLGIELRLAGELPADAAMRIRRAVIAVAESPLGELAGAIQWLTPEALVLEVQPGALRARLTVPWNALAALADAMRGQVAGSTIE